MTTNPQDAPQKTTQAEAQAESQVNVQAQWQASSAAHESHESHESRGSSAASESSASHESQALQEQLQMQSQRQSRELVSDPRKWAILAARAADEKKATDIVVQDVGALIGVTEYFVIVTAANNRQVNAIVDAIKEVLRNQADIRPFHQEDTRDGSWELLDYGSVVVHVFQPETREYYQLESLWSDAPLMDLATEAHITDTLYSERIAQLFEKASEKRAD